MATKDGVGILQQNNVVDEIIKTSAMNNREIHVYGTVCDDAALEIQHYINRLIKRDKEERLPDDDKKFTMIINSYGGSIWAGNIIVGAIQHAQSLGYKVKGVCQGFAFSMGFDILLACDEREGYSFSEYMVHQTSGGGDNRALVQQKRNIDYSTRQWNKCVDFYVEKTKIPRKKIEELYESNIDWFMLSEEALEYGVMHKILK